MSGSRRPRTMHKRLSFALALAAVLAAFAPGASAHVGSPDTWFEGKAGPYPVRVVVRAPGVVPGLAEIDVRVLAGHARDVSVQLYGWNVGPHGAPPPDPAKPVPGDPQLWSVQLWFMEATSYGVHVAISGPEGSGVAVIPVQAVATMRLGMSRGLGVVLIALGLFLFFGLVSVVGAGVREASLPPGVEPGPDRVRAARIAMAVAAVLLAAALYAGRNWWDSVDRGYVAGLYRPFRAQVTVVDTAGSRRVRLGFDDPRFIGRRWTPLIPDHGKLVHLFLVSTPAMGVMAHLHPLLRDSTHFEATLPPLPAGEYDAYADIVHESGFARTLTGHVTVPAGAPGSYVPTDIDDSWSAAPAVRVHGADAVPCALADGAVMTWEGAAALSSGRADAGLRFRVSGPGGTPAKLEPFLGMAAHVVVRSEDGSVFAHLHPTGSVAMASEMALTMRTPADSVAGTLGLRMTRAGDMVMDRAAPLEDDFGIPWGFPKPGRYRVWVQVRRADGIQTAAYDVEVTNGS